MSMLAELKKYDMKIANEYVHAYASAASAF